jgi:DNA mismatch repair protein MSH4
MIDRVRRAVAGVLVDACCASFQHHSMPGKSKQILLFHIDIYYGIPSNINMDRTVSSLPSRKRHRGLSSASVAASRGGAGRRRSHGRPDHFRGSQQAHAGKSVASRASSTRSARFSSTSTHPAQVPRQQSHVVCAISENLARETCIVSLDTACPMILNVTKQCNSQTYSETIACLSIVGPDEILMNEGRQHSPLAHKVMQHCKYQREAAKETLDAVGDTDSSSGSTTTIKFISRAFFDQTRGADLLRRLARKDTYDCNSLVQEYILLSSSHAVLQYTQKCLGLSFMNNCLDIRSFLYDTNGTICPRVMDIDRATIVQLELLASTRPGKGKQASLIAAMDCTKTSVGNRLLRSTIMSPPCRMATIQARLELVTTFLSNEQLFFSVLEQLKSLNPIDKMLSDVAMVPTTTAFNANGMGNASTNAASTVSGVYANTMTVVKQNVANARLARKGIASLIGIKTTLGMIPLIASTLKNHLKASIGTVHEKEGDAEASVATDRTSLLVGLGVGDFASLAATTLTKKTASTLGSNNVSRKHYLLRGIVFALSQPELENIRKEIDNSLRGNTMHSKSGNVQRHQECFALQRP